MMGAEPLIRRDDFIRKTRPASAKQNLALADAIVEPRRRLQPASRNFELHPGVFALLAGGFAAYLATMTLNFQRGYGMPLVLAICAICLIGYFGVPFVFARVSTGEVKRRQSWQAFLAKGVETGSGHASGGAVLGQVLIMPIMLILWATGIAIIKATVM